MTPTLLNFVPARAVTPSLYAIFKDWFLSRGREQVTPIRLLFCLPVGGWPFTVVSPPEYQVLSRANHSLGITV